MKDTLLSIGELARLLGIQGYRINYGHVTGKIPEPPRVAGKRVYDQQTVDEIAAYFGVEIVAKNMEVL